MTSSDVLYIINNGQEYRLNGGAITPVENYRSAETTELRNIETRLGAIETELKEHNARLSAVETEQQAQREALQIIGTEQRILLQKVDSLQTSVYWALGAVGIFLAALAIPSTITNLFHKDKPAPISLNLPPTIYPPYETKHDV